MKTTFLLSISMIACFVAQARPDDWPGWRGPNGQGHSSEKGLPIKWSASENVRWKVALPDDGNSTPIVWGNRVFLTQATQKGKQRALMCFDRANGKLLWERAISYLEPEPTHATNPFCSASPVTDGERVVASMGSAGLVCFDFDGKELWRKDVGKMTHIWGNASSPILWKNLAILWCGPGSQQTLLAVDKTTGKTVWEHKEPGGNGTETRPYVGSWSTPIVVPVDGHDELILTVPGKVKGFDPATGKELWSCDGLVNPDGDKVEYASVVFADGVVVALAGYGGAALAVLAGGQGDVTSKRLWHHPRNPQQIGSPVIVDGHVYVLSDTGLAQCLDLKTGKDSWAKARTTSSTWASLVAADGRLYVTNRDGESLVMAAKPQFELIAKNRLEEPVYGSIAIAGGELFIRSYKHLWCIGLPK